MTITAKDIMVTSFHTLSPTTPLLEAIALFREIAENGKRRAFGIMVMDEAEQLAGILSMEDILLFAQPKYTHIWGEIGDVDITDIIETVRNRSEVIQVGDIMSTGIVTVDVKSHLFMILSKMNQHHIRRIPVVDEQKVVGIVYLSDLFFHLLGQLK